jgi:uncharacterized protein
MKKSPVVHFEMPAKDLKRVAEFYSTAFGWDMNQLGPEMGDYLLAGTVDVDENMMAKEPGAINGGFFKYEDKKGYNMPHIVIQVENLEEAMDAVKKAGGTVEGKPMEIQGIGTYVSITDTENTNVGMLQPS